MSCIAVSQISDGSRVSRRETCPCALSCARCSVFGYLRLELLENAMGSQADVVFAASLRGLPDELRVALEKVGRAYACTLVTGVASGIKAGGGKACIFSIVYPSSAPLPHLRLFSLSNCPFSRFRRHGQATLLLLPKHVKTAQKETVSRGDGKLRDRKVDSTNSKAGHSRTVFFFCKFFTGTYFCEFRERVAEASSHKKNRGESPSNGSEIAECRVHSAKNPRRAHFKWLSEASSEDSSEVSSHQIAFRNDFGGLPNYPCRGERVIGWTTHPRCKRVTSKGRRVRLRKQRHRF